MISDDYKYTTFTHVRATTLSAATGWEVLVRLLQHPPRSPSKEQCPLLKLAIFQESQITEQMVACGYKSPRNDANLRAITGVEGDYDGGEVSLVDAATLLQAAGLEALLYTTASYSEDNPRWRVLVPLSIQHPVATRTAFLGHVNAMLGGILGRESWKLSSGYYYGHVDGMTYHCLRCVGLPLDKLVKGEPQPVSEVDTACMPEDWPRDLNAEEKLNLQKALQGIPADDRATWMRMGYALACYGEEGRKLWVEWSMSSAKYAPDDAALWDGFKPHTISPASIYYEANKGKSVTLTPHAQGKLPTEAVKTAKGTVGKEHTNLVYWMSKQLADHVIQYDNFSERVYINGAKTTNADCSDLRMLAEQAMLMPWSLQAVTEAINTIAYHNAYHEVQDWLLELVWDGISRLDSFFTVYYGVRASNYHRALARVLFLSAVWRVLEPGCQVDQSLLLVGKEGIGKSYGMATLFGIREGWVVDKMPPLQSKEAQSVLRGCWLVELAEMDIVTRSEHETYKAFLTRREEIYRPAYERLEVVRPRQCVFVGTTNDFEVLSVAEENRRFLPLILGNHKVNLEALKASREQLWAEAYARADIGERHPYLEHDFEELASMRSSVSLEDAYTKEVLDYLTDKDYVRTPDIALRVLGIPLERQYNYVLKRIGAILRAAGWQPHSSNGQRSWHKIVEQV